MDSKPNYLIHFSSFYRQKNLTKGPSTWLKELDKDVVLFLFDVCDDRSSLKILKGFYLLDGLGHCKKINRFNMSDLFEGKFKPAAGRLTGGAVAAIGRMA